MRNLIILLFVGAAIYLASAYYPVASNYVEARYTTKLIANRAAINGRDYNDIRKSLKELRTKTGLSVFTSDVVIEKDATGYHVEMRVDLPVEFKWIKKTHIHHTVLVADAKASGL